MQKTVFRGVALIFLFSFAFSSLNAAGQDQLTKLGEQQNYVSKRISSFDRTDGNADRLTIEPGDTAILAEIEGPAAIHHIWVTIAAEPFYARKLILRMYWDGEGDPSVEAPIGDFFGVGHGLNRNFSSLPLNCSSEGRARNCYWYMPLSTFALVTVTNEGTERVGAFYYYIDYRKLPRLSPDAPRFHAQYRQETPCMPNRNYLILDASGRGHYVGCVLSILQRSMGWWGEGDDMIFVDGEDFPSLYGTGSEDYFSDAWGMREDENLYYGCPLQEPDFQTGSKASVYRFHIPDPIPFLRSIRVTIEHGHANNRSDYFSSVAFWYQSEPHKPFPLLPSAEQRLPFALPSTSSFILPEWEKVEADISSFRENNSGAAFTAKNLSSSLTSFYNQQGKRYPVLTTEGGKQGDTAELSFSVDLGERYDIDLYLLKGPRMGNVQIASIRAGRTEAAEEPVSFSGYALERSIDKVSLKDIRLFKGENTIQLRVTGKSDEADGMELGFIGFSLTPSARSFIREWYVIGPFDAPDMTSLQTSYPPEKAVDVTRSYQGKNDRRVEWNKVTAEESGYIRLETLLTPNERAVAYGYVNVFSPKAISTHMLLGSDDGIRVWLNDELIHTNPAYRGAYPDQDKVPVNLKRGMNKLLVKVLQGGGGWGFYLRFVDPEGVLRWSTEIQ